jgi:hypothetical protein
MPFLSVINLAAVSHRMNRDGIVANRKQDSSIARPQPHARGAFQRLHVTDTSLYERFQLEIDLRTRRGSKFAPLSGGCRREFDLFHDPIFAQCDKKDKPSIA